MQALAVFSLSRSPSEDGRSLSSPSHQLHTHTHTHTHELRQYTQDPQDFVVWLSTLKALAVA